jgi:hypothetical protein
MGVYKKYVSPEEIDYAYIISTWCEYEGESFSIEHVEGDRALLSYAGPDKTIPRSRGFERIGPAEYEKWVDKRDLTRVWYGIASIWDYPLPPGMKEGRMYL